jgi:hypothetical protein
MEPLIPAALRLVWNIFWRFVTSMAGISIHHKGHEGSQRFFVLCKDIVVEQIVQV